MTDNAQFTIYVDEQSWHQRRERELTAQNTFLDEENQRLVNIIDNMFAVAQKGHPVYLQQGDERIKLVRSNHSKVTFDKIKKELNEVKGLNADNIETITELNATIAAKETTITIQKEEIKKAIEIIENIFSNEIITTTQVEGILKELKDNLEKV